MSEEVATARADMARIAELEFELASAHEALLLSEADSETLRTAALAYVSVTTYSERGQRLGQLRDLTRAEHPGQALANEVTRARDEIAILKQALDQIDRHVVGAHALSWDAMPEPCEECGEMREIASQALAKAKASAL